MGFGFKGEVRHHGPSLQNVHARDVLPHDEVSFQPSAEGCLYSMLVHPDKAVEELSEV